MLALALCVLFFALVLGGIVSGFFDKVDRVFKGGGTLALYGLGALLTMVLKLTGDAPWETSDAFVATLIVVFAMHRVGLERGWNSFVDSRLAGGWNAGLSLCLVPLLWLGWALSTNPRDIAYLILTTILLMGAGAYSLWKGSKAQS